MSSRLFVSIVVKMGVDNGCPIDNMAMIKETDIRIVKCENHKQNPGCYLLTFLRHQQCTSFTKPITPSTPGQRYIIYFKPQKGILSMG